MTFSVIVPVYNKAPHIERALESVRSQTFTDYEVVCVDDASTDGSRRALESYDGLEIRLFDRTDPGPGGYAARNLAMAHARGTFCAFLDADDEWSPSHLSDLQNLIDQCPECDLYSTGYTVTDGELEKPDGYTIRTRLQGTYGEAERLSTEAYLRAVLARVRPVHTSFTCVRRSAVPQRGLFPEWSEARRGGDLYAWLTLVCTVGGTARLNTESGVYHKDAQNMVTKTAGSSPALMSRSCFRELSPRLLRREKRLLKRYFNQQLRTVWTSKLVAREPSFFLSAKLYWSVDAGKNLCLTILSVIPRPLLRRVVQWRRSRWT